MIFHLISFSLTNDRTKLSQDKLKRKLVNKNIMKVLVTLATKQYSDGDLDLDEYNNSIYEAHSQDYICSVTHTWLGKIGTQALW